MQPHRSAIHFSSKPINAMNSLRDMGHFPAAVNAGATANILLTVACTLLVYTRFADQPLALPGWIALVLVINVMPVILLRTLHWRAASPMPSVAQMNFFHDQHRFADWVYLAASANMAFWITLSWVAYTLLPHGLALGLMLALVLLCTFAPVWLRLLRRPR